MKKIIVITAPTASGKTDLAVKKALELNCPIISADSRQIYKELNIGVAKPTQEQLNSVPHFFINHVSIHTTYNAGIFATEGRHLINQLFKYYSNIILCGGTGFYIHALLRGLDTFPTKNDDLRIELQNILETQGIQILQERLQSTDLELSKQIDLQNPQRLIRAIEKSEGKITNPTELPQFQFPIEIEYTTIQLPREILYQRINARVDEMIEMGLEKEALQFIEHKTLDALKTVGYSEWWDYFDNKISYKETIEKIKQHTRNYAKRQSTWIRNKDKDLPNVINL